MHLRTRIVVTVSIILTLGLVPLLAAGQSGQHPFGTTEFQQVWERTDLPIEQGVTSRTWMWGPHANTPVLQEPYEEADDGMRDVQYTDKSRMEMPVHPVDPGSDWFITQGLLATELMTGNMQLGDATFVQHDPSDAFVAGDPANNQSPTYAQMGELIDEPSRAGGEVITEMIQSDGSITNDPGLAGHGVTDAQHVGQTDNNIASVFWDFMNSTGTIYHDGQYGEGPVFTNPFYAIGFPITEAYWGNVTVGTQPQQVLMQCFERRCLTFTPDNDPAWQVESGNIGQHYYDWRYGMPHYPDDDDATDDTPPPADDDSVTDDTTDDHEETPEPASFIVSPTGTNADTGESHTITVTVEDQHSERYPGAEVRAQVTSTTGATDQHQGTWLNPDPAQTNDNGVAQLSYTGIEPGMDTITVSVDGIAETESVTHTWHDPDACTEVTAGESIQSAIDSASPGDEICVDFGVYEEALSITTNGLTLTGSFGAVLDGSNVTALDSVGISIEADDVTVQGLEIRNFLDANIVVGESSGVTLTDLNLLPQAETAISVYHSDTIEISDTDISLGPDTGPERTGVMMDTVTDATLENLDIEDADVGIILQSDPFDDDTPQATGTVRHSTIQAFGGIGIQLTGTGDVPIHNNEIQSGNIGINVTGFGTSGAIIEANTLAHGDFGIEVGGFNTVFITDNTLTNHTVGIQQSGLSSSEITQNTITDYDEIGISILDFATTTIDQNTIEQGATGVRFEEIFEAMVIDNVIRTNDIGIEIEDTDEMSNSTDHEQSFSGNKLTQNDAAMIIRADTDPTLLDVSFNDIVDNGDGIINQASGTLNATMNYWGDHSGPGGDGSGQGDSISGNIDYLPVHQTPITE